MKIVITGANSFIGQNFISHLKRLNASNDLELILVTRKTEAICDTRITNITCELGEYSKLGDKVGSCDCLFHLAWTGTRGNSRNNHAEQQYAKEYSILGIRSLLDRGCKKVITAGSQAEYGFIPEIVTERSDCKPNTEYGIQKLELYKNALALCTEYGAVCIEPRFFSLYGPGDYSGTMIISMLKRMLKNQICNLTECKQNWNFLFIDDACAALQELCLNNALGSGVFNFGSDDTRPLRDFVTRMKYLANSSSQLNFGAVPYPATGMVSIWPDNSKLKKCTNWKPEVPFDDGVKLIINTLKQ